MATKKTKQFVIQSIKIEKEIEGYKIEVIKHEKFNDDSTKWDHYCYTTKEEMMKKLSELLKEY